MSLYNMVCGNNPLFGYYARILETVEDLPPVPRYRDMYTRMAGDQVQIVLYTRTGGGNRSDYHANNLALTQHPLYIADFDDDFDSTFAHFVFSVPDEFRYELTLLHEEFSKFFKGKSPREKFDICMANLDNQDQIPDPEDVEPFAKALHNFSLIAPQQMSSLERALLPTATVTHINTEE